MVEMDIAFEYTIRTHHTAFKSMKLISTDYD